MKKIFLSTIFFLAMFLLVGIIKTKALDNASHGWIWGGSSEYIGSDVVITGVGWISVNSTDVRSGVNYAVNIPAANCVGSTCQATGYAWSGNDDGGKGGPLGWVDFDPQDHCVENGPADSSHYQASSCKAPDGSNGGVMRTTTGLTGWARFVGIAQETAKNNAGGYDGWISLNPDPQNNIGVTIDQNGVAHGYAWSELGALSFDMGADHGRVTVDSVAPVITLAASPDQINLTAGQSPLTSLFWKSTNNVPIDTCKASCEDANGNSIDCGADWPGTKSFNGASSDTVINIPVNVPIVFFKITCKGTNGIESAETRASVSMGCKSKTCQAATNKCDFGDLIPTANSQSAVNAACQDSCSKDEDCGLKQAGTWKEVAP